MHSLSVFKNCTLFSQDMKAIKIIFHDLLTLFIPFYTEKEQKKNSMKKLDVKCSDKYQYVSVCFGISVYRWLLDSVLILGLNMILNSCEQC